MGDTELQAPDPALRDASDVAADLGVDPSTGLSGEEAARRLDADGPNELRGTPPTPAWKRFVAQFNDPLVYLLLVAIVISIVAWLLEGAQGIPVDGIVITAIVLLNAIIGFVEENKASDAVAALADMTAATSTVLRDGVRISVPSSELVRGDILVLAEGDAVGADARLLTATALRVQEAALTGESVAAEKDMATLEEAGALGDRHDMVFKGTAVARGVGTAVVTATGMGTEMGNVAELLDATESDPSPLSVEIARVSKMLGIIVIAIAVIVMGTLFLVNDVSTASQAVAILLLGVSLAVAAVPEGLPAILTVVLAIGVQRLAARNAVVKDLHSVETLGSASVICSDKTGTLTKNEMTVERVVTPSGRVDVSGIGYRPEGEASVAADCDEAAALQQARRVLTAGSLANDSDLREIDGEWGIQGDPTEAAFLVAAHKLDGVRDSVACYERAGEVPFSSERKMMSTLQRPVSGADADPNAPAGVTEAGALVAKGAPDVLLDRCSHLLVGDDVVPLDDQWRERVLADVEALSDEAFRTLGTAYRPVAEGEFSNPDDVDEDAERDMIYLGMVGIIDPPRDEARVAVADAHRAGIRVVMITGDHPGTAARIASDLGIVDAGSDALTGVELDRLDEAGFAQAARDVSVFARVAPEHKIRIVDVLQDDGHVVSMTGDGVNDAPALKSADIGVAMGITGTEVTKQASTMILGDDNFATIVAAVRQGRVIFENIKKFLRYLLSSNMGEVVTVFFGVVLAGVLGFTDATAEGTMFVPLLATQILWINLVTDTAPALAMGIDPEIDDVMARSPRDPKERIIDRRMWSGILSIGIVMGAITLLTMDIFLPGGFFEGTDSLEVARTAGFTTLVLAQLFNALNARSETTSAFHSLFTNKWLWAALAFGVVAQLAVVELPLLQTAFGTASLGLDHWLVCAAMASVVLWYDEIRKAVYRALHQG
ncbi:MAG: cation-translocating P-type ATPase [Dermatophilus congolensis]|nr:cation-translocating P-type ATPase [Dermatophilus congolensis]